MITTDSIIKIQIPGQEIVLTLEDVKNAKNIWIGKDIKITDDALSYALVNGISIHKDLLKSIDKDAIISKYKENILKIENKNKLEKNLGITMDDLRELIK